MSLTRSRVNIPSSEEKGDTRRLLWCTRGLPRSCFKEASCDKLFSLVNLHGKRYHFLNIIKSFSRTTVGKHGSGFSMSDHRCLPPYFLRYVVIHVLPHRVVIMQKTKVITALSIRQSYKILKKLCQKGC